MDIHGQKGHYGVAMFSKQAPLAVRKGWITDDEDAQKRMIMADFPMADGRVLSVLNGYFPQGESRKQGFPAKEKFYADLMAEIDSRDENNPLVIMGDFNISPEDIDIGIGEPTVNAG